MLKSAKIRVLLLTTIALTLLASISWADEFVPVYHPQMEISPVEGTIAIDGRLDDSGWLSAATAGNFAEHSPGDQTKPPVDTKVYMTYDSERLYVAIVAYDEPDEVRASICRRERVHGDDNVGFFFDTFGDATWAYTMNCNPHGIQADALWSNGHGEDGGYDLIWESEGMLTDSGWQVEMAIPFSSLRFPDKEEQVWRVDFWRNHTRETYHSSSWAAYDRDESCWPCQWGTVTGIRGVRPGRGFEVMPEVIAYQAGGMDDDDEFDNGDPDGEASLGIKYAVSSSVTAEATYNPDFSQIEADASQIDVNTTTALFYAERRPFFQEGSDLFRTTFQAVYTRAINDPLVAGKTTGRLGKTSFAYLGAYDEHTPIVIPLENRSAYVQADGSVSNLFRLKQTVAENSHMGILATDRRLDDGGSNTLLGFDGSLRLSREYSMIWQVLGTYTAEPDDTTMTAGLPAYYGEYFDGSNHTLHYDGESYWGDAAYFGISREDRHFSIDLAYLQKSPTFRADLGYQPTNDRRKGQLYAGYQYRTDRGLIRGLSPNVTLSREWNYRGNLNDEIVKFQGSINLGYYALNIHPRFVFRKERYKEVTFDGIWERHICVSSTVNSWLSAGGSANFFHEIYYQQDPIMSNSNYLSVWLDVRPLDNLLIENWFNYTRGESLEGVELYDGFTARTRWNYQFTRELALRLVVEYDDFHKTWDADPLITYQLNPFSVLYAGTSYGYEEYGIYSDPEGDDDPVRIGDKWQMCSRQFFIKLKYLFQS
jgi:hypothetical protein